MRIVDPVVEPPPVVNEPFLREVLAFIELHPERWDQRTWGMDDAICGTVHCLAGWAVALAEDRPQGLGCADHVEARMAPTAQRLLGLTREQARELFYFTSVAVVIDNPFRGLGGQYGERIASSRSPTFADLCAKVEEVTGVRFKPAETLEVPA